MTEETNQMTIEFELCVTLDLFSPDDPSRPYPPKGTHFGKKFSFAIVPLSAFSPFNHAGLLHLECNRKEENDGT